MEVQEATKPTRNWADLSEEPEGPSWEWSADQMRAHGEHGKPFQKQDRINLDEPRGPGTWTAAMTCHGRCFGH